MRLEDLGLRVVASCSLESVGGRLATTSNLQPSSSPSVAARRSSFGRGSPTGALRVGGPLIGSNAT